MKLQKVRMKLAMFVLVVLPLWTSPQPGLACTSLVFKTQDGTTIYGRTMEWGASDLKSEMVLVPRQMAFKSAINAGKPGMEWKNRYGFVGVKPVDFRMQLTDERSRIDVGVLFYPGFAEFQEPMRNRTIERSAVST